ncbi:MAG: sugar transferase [Kiritimatiellae bacterium]|nr:sugar transferase [Kiritimatiellia bacterium]
MKRLLDILLVVLAFPLWLSLLGAVALAVLAVDGRPVFFRQERAGKGGVPFRMLKFRTMRDGAGTDETRLTRLGRFLRASSLDELPELLHVLAGTMSLVGPRPLPTRYLPRYSPEQARRHEVRPGITGWAQVHGRNLLSWEDKFAYDVWYVDHRSLFLDVKILFLTVATVLGARGIASEKSATMEEFTGGNGHGT